MVFQSQKLSFDAGSLDDLDLEGPQIDLPEPEDDYPIKPPMKADSIEDPIQAFNFDLEELLKRGREQATHSAEKDIKVNVNQSDNFTTETTKENKQSFREFLYQKLDDTPLPPSFGGYVNQSISAINGCFASTHNDKYICNNGRYDRVGIVVRCDLDECRFTVPNTDAALGRDTIRGGGLIAGPFSDATLLIIGIPEDIDVSEYLSENKGNYRNHFSQIAENINSPVLVYGTVSNNTSGHHHFSVNDSATIVQPDGRIEHFTPGN